MASTTLVVILGCLATSWAATSPATDSTDPTRRNLFVHPYYKTSPRPSSPTKGPDFPEPRPPLPARRYRPRIPGLRRPSLRPSPFQVSAMAAAEPRHQAWTGQDGETWGNITSPAPPDGNTTASDPMDAAPVVLSESTIWTLVLCGVMIAAAVAFFAVVLAVCRCRQRRERHKRCLTAQTNIRVMQDMVKMAARKKQTVPLGQGPFARIA